MQIVSQHPEAALLELVRGIRENPADHYALHFHLSQLQAANRSDFQLKIAFNILNDVFRHKEGAILPFPNGDIFVLYHGTDREMLEKAIFQLRYLFIEDPLSSHADGSENEAFCTTYDLTFQWRQLYRVASQRMELSTQEGLRERLARSGGAEEKTLTAAQLAEIEDILRNVDFGLALRRQPICAIRNRIDDMRRVYNEIYVNSGHLARMLGVHYSLTSDIWLFRHLTYVLDRYVLNTLGQRPHLYFEQPVSINLNVQTILSPLFVEFHDKISKKIKGSLVIEIDVVDVFADMASFHDARKLAAELGYRICLDGLDTASFTHLSRESLGFDLAKIKWNADFVDQLDNAENKRLANAIEKCGANRLILCRCETRQALDYGKALGISLFQGRYVDKVMNPDAKVEN